MCYLLVSLNRQKYSKLQKKSGTENTDSMFLLWDQYFLTGFIRYLKEYSNRTTAVGATCYT